MKKDIDLMFFLLSPMVVSLFIVLFYGIYNDFIRKRKDYPTRAFLFPIILLVSVPLLIGSTVMASMNVEDPAVLIGNVPKNSHPNIILITFDTLTSRHMSLYGYERTTTPQIDYFASRSFVFHRMIANSNHTPYSLPCFLGEYPQQWLERGHENLFMKMLEENGYKDRIFFTNDSIIPYIEFQEKAGFSKIMVTGNSDLAKVPDRELSRLNYDFNLIYNTLKEAKTPVFLWAHFWEAHSPYISPRPFSGCFGNSPEDCYDANILYLDFYLRRFLNRLRNDGYYDNSIIILSSDHGENFDNPSRPRDAILNQPYSNDRLIYLPLIIHLPHQKTRIDVQTFAEHVDLAPTLAELLGLGKPEWMVGESLLPYMKSPERMSRKLKLNLLSTDAEFDMAHVFYDRFKVVWGKYKDRPENGDGLPRINKGYYYQVFDIIEDPEQKDNLINTDQGRKVLKRVNGDKIFDYFRRMYYGEK